MSNQQEESSPLILDIIPTDVTVITYPNGLQVQLGNELTPAQVKDQPSVVWNQIDQTAFYTVLMVDPLKKNILEVLHWLVVNVPGGDISSGDTIMPYGGSCPPDDAPVHPYIFLIFLQKEHIGNILASLKADYPEQNRAKFNTQNLVTKLDLGSPISRNYFEAGPDDHSRKRRGVRLVAALEAQQVVPDVIDSVPNLLPAEVKYSSGAKMYFGAELTPTSVKDIPELVLWKGDPNALYSLVLTDPDAPSRADPKFREFLHWIVVNIPGNDLTSGDTLVEYVGSGPPLDSGLHRYVFLVYKQPNRITPDEKHVSKTSREGRRSFKARAFAAKYGLEGPVFGNFYQAQYDDYVPKVHEQLSRGD